MSKFVKVRTELRNPAMIRSALADLKLGWTEQAVYKHLYSGSDAPVAFLVQGTGALFGLREGNDGVFEVVGDDMQMASIRAIMQPLQQRYAYHTVLAEAQKVGFELVEEKVGSDNVIRMTVRRWS